jgi:hypothetical protein
MIDMIRDVKNVACASMNPNTCSAFVSRVLALVTAALHRMASCGLFRSPDSDSTQLDLASARGDAL